MAKREKPKFFAFNKDFNTGELEKFDVLEGVFNEILTRRGKLNKKFKFYSFSNEGFSTIDSRESLSKFLDGDFFYRYGAKCEHEVIIVDWPYRELVEDSRPHKIDVYWQLKMNFEVIVELVWNYIKEDING